MARTTPNPGHNLDYHLIPFEAAFKAGARQIMLYYSRPIGTQYEEVGASFNKGLITDLLRGHYGFEGIVVTDWGLLTSRNYSQPLVAIAWGVEDLTPEERIVRIIEAGCDQFRGQANTDMVVGLVKNGPFSEDRIDVSVRCLPREKFLLCLFENPYTDPAAAEHVVGNDYFMRAGKETQRRAYTLLSNKNETLPLRDVTMSRCARATMDEVGGFSGR